MFIVEFNGELINNKKEGNGIMKYNNGDIYDGKWMNDKFVNGKITYNNGNEYEGNCDDKKKKGHGIMKYKNEELYDGYWENDVREGSGILIMKIYS